MKQSIVQILFYVLQSGIKALSAPFTLPQSLLLDRFISLGSAFSSEAHVQNAQKWSSRDDPLLEYVSKRVWTRFLLENSHYGCSKSPGSCVTHMAFSRTFEGQCLNSRDRVLIIILIGAKIMIPKEWQSFCISSVFRPCRSVDLPSRYPHRWCDVRFVTHRIKIVYHHTDLTPVASKLVSWRA